MNLVPVHSQSSAWGFYKANPSNRMFDLQSRLLSPSFVRLPHKLNFGPLFVVERVRRTANGTVIGTEHPHPLCLDNRIYTIVQNKGIHCGTVQHTFLPILRYLPIPP